MHYYDCMRCSKLFRLLALAVVAQLVQPLAVSSQSRYSTRVEIAFSLYTSTRPVATSPKRLLREGGMVNATIRDPRLYWYLDSVVKHIDLQEVEPDLHSLDVRIACVLHRRGRRNDTISFSSGYMQVNGRIGYLQPQSLVEVARFLPCEYVEDIRQYLNDAWLRLPNRPKYDYKPDLWSK